MILDLHHIQLAMPEGGEDAARGFYGSVLGLEGDGHSRVILGNEMSDYAHK